MDNQRKDQKDIQKEPFPTTTHKVPTDDEKNTNGTN